jgi:hypothetical protein
MGLTRGLHRLPTDKIIMENLGALPFTALPLVLAIPQLLGQ